MELHDLPLAVLEVQNECAAKIDLRRRTAERDFRARPAHRPFLPTLDLVPGEREAAGFIDLLPPDRGVFPVPPLLGVRPDPQHARVLGDLADDGIGIRVAHRSKPTVDDATDLLGTLHRSAVLRARRALTSEAGMA